MGGEGRLMSEGQLPTTDLSAGKSFSRGVSGVYRQRKGALCRNSTVCSDSHLDIGRQWSDQRHRDCFRYGESSVPGSVCSHFPEASSRNCGSLCHGYSLVVV